MKKAPIIALIIILGSAGFLAYDWHVKTTIQEDDQRVTLYSWTDEKGAKHYTNTQPPDNAKNIEERKGYKYVEPPLVVKIKDKTLDMYQWTKEKLFKKKDRKKKSFNRPTRNCFLYVFVSGANRSPRFEYDA